MNSYPISRILLAAITILLVPAPVIATPISLLKPISDKSKDAFNWFKNKLTQASKTSTEAVSTKAKTTAKDFKILWNWALKKSRGEKISDNEQKEAATAATHTKQNL